MSAYLKDAERLTGEALRPRAKRDGKAGFVDLIERTRVTRRIGKYAASIWGWHNLRHNFITVALNNGVPLHKVSAIVGHSTTSMTASYADMGTKTGRRSTAKALPEKPSTDAFIASLSASERKDLARKLLGL